MWIIHLPEEYCLDYYYWYYSNNNEWTCDYELKEYYLNFNLKKTKDIFNTLDYSEYNFYLICG